MSLLLTELPLRVTKSYGHAIVCVPSYKVYFIAVCCAGSVGISQIPGFVFAFSTGYVELLVECFLLIQHLKHMEL